MELTEIKPSHPNFFEQLPIDIVSHIYQFLSLEDAAALGKTNAKIQELLLSLIIKEQRILFTRIGNEIKHSFAFINEKFPQAVEAQTETSLALLAESDSLKKVREISLQLKHGIIKAALGSEGINKTREDLDHYCPWLEPHLYLQEIFEVGEFTITNDEFSWRCSKVTEELMRALPDDFTEKLIGFAEKGEFNKKGGILYKIIWEGLTDLSNQQQVEQALRLAQKIEDKVWRNQTMLYVLETAENIVTTFLSEDYLLSLDNEARIEALCCLLPRAPIQTLDSIIRFFGTEMKKEALVPCFYKLYSILLSGYNGIQKLANLISPLSEEKIEKGLFPLFKTLEAIYKKHSEDPAYFVTWRDDLPEGERIRRGIDTSNYFPVITIIERQVEWGESNCVEMFERSLNLLRPLPFHVFGWQRRANDITESFRIALSHATSKDDASKLLKLCLQQAKKVEKRSRVISKIIKKLIFDLIPFTPNPDFIDVSKYTSQLAKLIKELDTEHRAVLESKLLDSFPRLRDDRHLCLRLYILAGIVEATFAPGEKKEEISELIIQEWNHILEPHPERETVKPPQLIMGIIKGITDPERKMRVLLSLRNYDFYTVVAGGYVPLLPLLERIDLIEDEESKKRLQKVFFQGWLFRVSKESETSRDAMITALKGHMGKELFQECLIQTYANKTCFFGRLEYLPLSLLTKLWKEVENSNVRDEAVSELAVQTLQWDLSTLTSDDFKQFIHELGKDLIVNPQTKAELIKFVIQSLREREDSFYINLATQLEISTSLNEGSSTIGSLLPDEPTDELFPTNFDEEGSFPWS